MEKIVQNILVYLKIVKSNGRYKNGKHITAGVYWWNPLSYPIVLLISIVMAIQAAAQAFIQCWFEVWAN